MRHCHAEIVVAGGGPAGLAVAIRAREQGSSVIVVDARRPPIDKACGEGIMPNGVALLDRLGVRIPPDRCHRFHGIRWLDEASAVEASFPIGPESACDAPTSTMRSSLAPRRRAPTFDGAPP